MSHLPACTVDVHSYLSRELYEWLRRTAFAERVSISEYIRRLIEAAQREAARQEGLQCFRT